MEQPNLSREVRLSIPAEQPYAMVAGMALCGVGMLAGLDVDMLGDLRTVTRECIDCLSHQARKVQSILVTANVRDGRLHVCFQAEERTEPQPETPLDIDITRGVLETLMPEVTLSTDENGVYGIACSMPV